MPERLQRQRTKGWRKPENCVIVSRPSRFGNPFTLALAYELGYAPAGDAEAARRAASGAFQSWLDGDRNMWTSPKGDEARDRILADLPLLRGKDLACTCPLPEPGEPDHCHAVALLRLANITAAEATEEPTA
ncbi:DUF4326 domain-containing protein [Streptomyces sp. NPDC058657]|uniref:DUF4326 domain-containing protein n=1 Tax=unclassified Streptomyces TaxID=2593676 RepID=UPI003669906D